MPKADRFRVGYWARVESDYVDRAQAYARAEATWHDYLDRMNLMLDHLLRFGV